MKNYSSNRAQKGKTAYRTPSPFKASKAEYFKDIGSRKINKQLKMSKFKFLIPNKISND